MSSTATQGVILGNIGMNRTLDAGLGINGASVEARKENTKTLCTNTTTL